VTQEHHREENLEFIKKDECPPQSPDLNPMDYTIWDSLSEKVYAGRTEKFTEQEHKDKIQEKWAEISLANISN
jgi:hypothetical protein